MIKALSDGNGNGRGNGRGHGDGTGDGYGNSSTRLLLQVDNTFDSLLINTLLRAQP